MTEATYKLWTTLTQPVLIKGIPLDYGAFLLLSGAVIYTFSFNNYYLAAAYIIFAYGKGLILTKSDAQWFMVALSNVRYFAIRPFRRWRYVA